MSIQQSINQGLAVGSLLATQSPTHQAKVEQKQHQQQVEREQNAIKQQLSPIAKLGIQYFAGTDPQGRLDYAQRVQSQAADLYQTAPTMENAKLLQQANKYLDNRRMQALEKTRQKAITKAKQKADIRSYINITNGSLGDPIQDIVKPNIRGFNR